LPVQVQAAIRAIKVVAAQFSLLAEFFYIASTQESWPRRFRAVVHTLLGACFAAQLRDRAIAHIHVHHGYFASWVAMVAARLLGISFSMTLHGSDLLLHHAFLGQKLRRCLFCLTISDFNRRHILKSYPEISPDKIRVQRLGVQTINSASEDGGHQSGSQLIMLSVGRLHRVKDHAFLLRACAELKRRGVWFVCLIAGDGPEREALQRLAGGLSLEGSAVFLGHVPHEKLEAYYSICDLVVLTSRSEGIPLVLMEAMAHSRIVLAPAITGIPELVLDGQTGFLYRPGDTNDFVDRVGGISRMLPGLNVLRRRARRHVLEHFNRERNLEEFAELFPKLVREAAGIPDANLVLQQI